MIAIKNARAVLDDSILEDAVILVENTRIAKVGTLADVTIPSEAQIIDAQGLYVGPGFVDIHVHGGGGNMFYAAPIAAAEHFLAHGETSLLATLYYDLSKEDLVDSIKRVKEAMKQEGAGRAIKGIYMEGPYMNPKYGAKADKNQWRGDILPQMYEKVVDGAGSLAKVWAVAPEREGIEQFLKYAKKVNPEVMISVGHSEANPEQIEKLKRYGIGLLTHCMDATGRVTTWGGTRACGPDEYCMTDSDMYAEVICDSMGIHVNPALIRMILKIKGVDKIVLITDSFVSNEQAPKELQHVTDLQFDHNGGLCGSKLTMDMACRNMMTHTNCGIAQVFLMASRNPARVIGMEDEIGTIAVGKKANLVFVDDAFDVDTVMLEGKLV